MNRKQELLLPEPHYLCPPWSGRYGVEVYSTTRIGGVSKAPYDSFNLGLHVDDDPQSVQTNRQRLRQSLSLKQEPYWLKQVHGTHVVEAVADLSCVSLKAKNPATKPDAVIEADGAWTNERLLPLAVLTADCLPVVLATGAHNPLSAQQKKVAAVHAGWRGMAAGILQTAIESMDAQPKSIAAWLGPAIGPRAFEVGQDVYDAFASSLPGSEKTCFRPVGQITRSYQSVTNQPGVGEQAANDTSNVIAIDSRDKKMTGVSAKGSTPSDSPTSKRNHSTSSLISASENGANKWLCDLYGLARYILTSYGITEISGGNNCTHDDRELFYSHRRDGSCTGRMATIAIIREN